MQQKGILHNQKEKINFAVNMPMWGALIQRAENIPYESEPGNAGVENFKKI